MNSQKRNFQASQGLLEDVMRKQAGSIEKAILEAVMNSVDAGADTINIELNETHLTVKDDGDGLTEEDVTSYFEQFGLKDSDVEDKEFGKFRIGRGQIFNFGRNVWRSQDNVLVVNLNEDKTELSIDGEDLELDTSGLSYNLVKTDTEAAGCNIIVDLYNELDDPSKHVDEARELIKYVAWVHDVRITLNGEEVTNDFEYEIMEDNCWIKQNANSFGRGIILYNQGAKVEVITETPIRIEAVSKVDLDVNFARNAVLDTCEETPEIIQAAKNFAFQKLLENDNYSSRETRWLLEQATGDDRKLAAISHVKLFRDVKGDMWSISELSGEKVAFKSGGGSMARRAMDEKGMIIIDGDYKELLDTLVEDSNIMSYRDVVEKEMKWEMREVDEDELSKRRLDNLDLARDFLDELNFRCDVKPGHSQEEDVWKSDEGTVYIDRGYLNSKKKTFRIEALLNVYRIACHDGSTQTGFDDNYSFHRTYAKESNRLGEVMLEFQNK